MFACCQNCYDKYLNKDLTLNKKALSNCFNNKNIEIISEERKQIKVEGKIINLCSCHCHVIGTTIFH